MVLKLKRYSFLNKFVRVVDIELANVCKWFERCKDCVVNCYKEMGKESWNY